MHNYTPEQVIEQSKIFLEQCSNMRKEYYEKQGYDFALRDNDHILKMQIGKKYIKFISKNGGVYGSLWCFIDLSNGDILKGASWNKPAKHARGNIFDAEPLKAVSVHGPNYLR